MRHFVGQLGYMLILLGFLVMSYGTRPHQLRVNSLDALDTEFSARLAKLKLREEE